MEKHWYAVYTIVRHEKKIASLFSLKELDNYCPIVEVASQWKDRKKIVHSPLFPGYLFVNINHENRWDVLNTPGVVRILGQGKELVTVPYEQIETIRRLVESRIRFDPYTYFEGGREVEVVRGPLTGARGRIVERRGNYRLILSVDLIQRSVSTEVDIDDVELI